MKSRVAAFSKTKPHSGFATQSLLWVLKYWRSRFAAFHCCSSKPLLRFSTQVTEPSAARFENFNRSGKKKGMTRGMMRQVAVYFCLAFLIIHKGFALYRACSSNARVHKTGKYTFRPSRVDSSLIFWWKNAVKCLLIWQVVILLFVYDDSTLKMPQKQCPKAANKA